MNDRYLFRGRRIDNGKWVIGHLQEYENGGAAIKEPLALWPNALYQSIDPATVGQCTGVSAAKSYRGKEPEDLLIFEGDVLRVPIEHYGPDHPVRIVEWSGGQKFDSKKLRYDLVPLVAFQGDAEVLTFGAKKYGDRNWEQGIGYLRLYAAAMRYLLAWRGGEDIDPESGLHHLAHARVNMAMIMALSDEWDDRNEGNRAENSLKDNL